MKRWLQVSGCLLWVFGLAVLVRHLNEVIR
jgi:hypothetical protein